MNKAQRILEIERKCYELNKIEYQWELSDWYYLPIIDLIDINDENFALKVYIEAPKKILNILCNEIILISITEVLQTSLILNFLREKSLFDSGLVDDLLIHDVELSLFFNYDESPNENEIKKFTKLYNHLREYIKEKRKEKIIDKNIILSHFDYVINFVVKNNHEYFKYVYVYWLKLYFNESISKIKNQEQIESYKSKLNNLFPYRRF